MIPENFNSVYYIHCGFYESPNIQNQMCELCTSSQIRSHNIIIIAFCFVYVAGTAEDKVRMFIIYYLADMSEVCGCGLMGVATIIILQSDYT